MEKRSLGKKRGEKLLPVFCIAAAVVLLAVLTAGFYLDWIRSRQQTAAAVPAFPAAEAKKEEPADRRAAEEKIPGYAHPEALISIYELNEKYGDPNVCLLDTRGRSYRVFQTSYPVGHLPGAVPVLHESYCHPAYPERLAPPLQMQNLLGELGVDNGSVIVLYGNDGLQARLYWAVRMYGYDKVKILDGGYEKWKEAGFDLTTANCRRPRAEFEFDPAGSKTRQFLATTEEVEAAAGHPDWVIIDARTRDEYLYRHIPGSINISSAQLFQDDKTFKTASDLKRIFEGSGVTREKKVIVYSDSGVRSSLVWFALAELLGYPDVKNYDGSLNEWIKLEQPVEGAGAVNKPPAAGRNG